MTKLIPLALLLTACSSAAVKPGAWNGKTTLRLTLPDDTTKEYRDFDRLKPTAIVMPDPRLRCTVTPSTPESFVVRCEGDHSPMTAATKADCAQGSDFAALAVSYGVKAYFFEFECR